VFENKKLYGIVGSKTLAVKIYDVIQRDISLFIVDLSLGHDLKAYRGQEI
jgi:hypothetical protein